MCEHGGSDNRDLLATLDAAADLLRAAGRMPLSASVGDTELTQAVQKLEAVARIAQGQKMRAVGELEQRQAHRGQAAATMEDLLARTLRLSQGEARRDAELAQGLALVPDTAKALEDGRIGLGQAHVAVKKAVEVKDRSDAGELLATIDGVAASAGQVLDRNRLSREIDAEIARTGVDVLAQRERSAFTRRSLSWTVREGMHVLHAELDPVGGATVRAMLDSLSDKTDDKDSRSFLQRQADALVHMATLANDGRGKARGTLQSARVLLITTPDALHGVEGAEPAVLDGHGPVSTELARQLCCDATVNLVAMSDGNILDATPDHRLPTGRQRAAVIARDRACVGCGAAVSQCEIHHIIWFSDHGPTVVDNLVLVCWRCHTHIHQHGWKITKEAGRYRAGPPVSTPLLDKCIPQTEVYRTG